MKSRLMQKLEEGLLWLTSTVQDVYEQQSRPRCSVSAPALLKSCQISTQIVPALCPSTLLCNEQYYNRAFYALISV